MEIRVITYTIGLNGTEYTIPTYLVPPEDGASGAAKTNVAVGEISRLAPISGLDGLDYPFRAPLKDKEVDTVPGLRDAATSCTSLTRVLIAWEATERCLKEKVLRDKQ